MLTLLSYEENVPCKNKSQYSLKEVSNVIQENSSTVGRKTESKFSINSKEFKNFISLLQKELLPNLNNCSDEVPLVHFIRNFSSESRDSSPLQSWKFLDHGSTTKVNYTNNFALANHLRWIAPASKTTHHSVQKPPPGKVGKDRNFKNLEKKSLENMSPPAGTLSEEVSPLLLKVTTQNLVELGNVEQSNSQQQYSDSSIPVSPPTVNYPLDSPGSCDDISEYLKEEAIKSVNIEKTISDSISTVITFVEKLIYSNRKEDINDIDIRDTVNLDVRFKNGFNYYMASVFDKAIKGQPIEYTKKRWNPYDKKKNKKKNIKKRSHRYYDIISVLKYKYESEVKICFSDCHK